MNGAMRETTTGAPLAIASSTQSPKPSLTEANTSARREPVERRHVVVGDRRRSQRRRRGANGHSRERSANSPLIGAVVEQARAAGDDQLRRRAHSRETRRRLRACAACSCAPRRRRRKEDRAVAETETARRASLASVRRRAESRAVDAVADDRRARGRSAGAGVAPQSRSPTNSASASRSSAPAARRGADRRSRRYDGRCGRSRRSGPRASASPARCRRCRHGRDRRRSRGSRGASKCADIIGDALSRSSSCTSAAGRARRRRAASRSGRTEEARAALASGACSDGLVAEPRPAPRQDSAHARRRRADWSNGRASRCAGRRAHARSRAAAQAEQRSRARSRADDARRASPIDERDLGARSNRADRGGMRCRARGTARATRADVAGATATGEAEARKGLQPAFERDAGRRLDRRRGRCRSRRPNFRRASLAVPTMPPWLMSLAARASPRSAISRQKREIAAQPRGRRVERGLPIVERLAIARRDGRSPRPARSPGRASKLVSSRRPARPRTATASCACVVRRLVWPPTIGDAVGLAPRRCRPSRIGAAAGLAVGPDRIDDRDRPAAHRGDVGEVDHHAAPAGEPGVGGDEFVDEAFDGEQQIAVAVRNRGAIVADRNRGAARGRAVRRRAPMSALAARPRAVAQRRASRSKSAPSISGRLPRARRSRSPARGRADRRRGRRASSDAAGRAARPRRASPNASGGTADRSAPGHGRGRSGSPSHAPRTDGEPDQRRADRADAAIVAVDREPRAPPEARRLLVDAHRADHPVGGDAEHRERDDRDGVVVDRVAVVAREEPLLVAEHGAPQRAGAVALPARGGELDAELAGQERRERIRRS